MLNTALCDILGIDVPIILAPMGTCTSAEFAAAVSNEGGLGGIGSLFRTTAAVKRDIDLVKTLTNKPYAVNHIPQTLDAEAFRHTLAARPAVISFALGDPGDLVRQAHDVGSRVMLQVTTVAQAIQAAERGVRDHRARRRGGRGRPCRSESACRRSLQPLSPIQNNSDLAQGLFQIAPLKSGVATSIWRQEGYMAPIPKPARFEFTVGMVLAMALTILVVMTWAVAAPSSS